MNVLHNLLGAVLLALAGAGVAIAGENMRTGGYTSQPIGHYDFCKKYRAECSIVLVDLGPARISEKLWQVIVSVNNHVNRSIRPMSDQDIFKKDEVWAYPTKGAGDCEDYVLEKRRLLAKKGIPLSDLLITVVRKRDGEGHAVLTVRTVVGDYILDNLTDAIRPWNRTGYRFLKRQASTHTGRWVSLRQPDPVTVASTRDSR